MGNFDLTNWNERLEAVFSYTKNKIRPALGEVA